jgi:hypothetical protein
MKNVVKFPNSNETNEKLSAANELSLKNEAKKTAYRPTFIDFLKILFGIDIKSKKSKLKYNDDKVVDIGVEKQRPTINPIIKKMYYNNEYTVNHLAHYTFIVNGEDYTFGIIELEMMGIFNK